MGLESSGKVICRKSGDTQGVVKLEEALRLTDHHDTELSELTAHLNALFQKNLHHRGGRERAILRTRKGLFLAWTVNEHDRTWDELSITQREELISIETARMR